MAEERLLTAYLALVLNGVPFEDVRLALLRELMTPDEIEAAKQAIGAEWLRREPVSRPN